MSGTPKTMAIVVIRFLSLQILLLALHLHSVLAYNNITRGSALTANNQGTSWKSPSGEFALGFREIEGGGRFLLAIWFDKIPEKTIFWSANGNDSLKAGSTVQLTQHGLFVVSDPEGRAVWSANESAASYAAMLDTGNFLLAKDDHVVAWQSFDHPTDTLLPTQALDVGNRLVARFSETNFASGRFELMLKDDGDLALYTRNYPLDAANFNYWSAGTPGSGFQVIFRPTGTVELVGKEGTSLREILSAANPGSIGTYQRAVLDYNGVLRLYIYQESPRSNASGGWISASFVPADICMSITEDTGSGACGFNSYCRRIGERTKCECPPRYAFVDPSDDLGGCKRTFPAQTSNGGESAEEYELVELVDTDWPLSDYQHYNPVEEDFCRRICLQDFNCDCAIFREDNCWLKKMPLSNGRINPSVGGKALIKVRNINATAKSEP